MTRGDTKRDLLDAATEVLRDHGPNGFTLEAVARAAGVSKGGLLHHFPNKRALIDAVIVDALDLHETMASALGTDGWIRGYVRACDIGDQTPEERAVDVAVLAVTTSGESSIAPMQDRWATWQRRVLDEAADPVDATIARLAADGLWQANVLGFAPPTGELLRDVISRLEELARPKWSTPSGTESTIGSQRDASGTSSSSQ